MTITLNDLAILPATTEKWLLVYQDEHLLVVNKPTHLLTVPGRHPQNQDCLINRVQLEFPSASVVHRLDYDTSGLLVLPLTKKALSTISKEFQSRGTKKIYQAVVSGVPEPSEGTVDKAIAADADNRPLYKISAEGKASVTHYKVLKALPEHGAALVQLEPVTGRSHQLRLHMQSIGHAILGDPFYATQAQHQQSSRLLLHATVLEFTHPQSGLLMSFTAEPDFLQALC
ncbi:MAG: RNA pseudouridine synthase [Gammaproteobacteria bacterium]|nr:RNA pseudouridine synthase [Gammaproteobacteria bacterium]MBU2057081.1 RNA pseudouridine synthase [Gammaproteobacteria bacterium]MBU2175140.1 RNA pseudouridine synthase [Gammaproteobacteria bacterium]MBU2245171.1 RNA pseudouridine synthase [Gammaproteobacteria bacterium]MBU2343538.1 RNA pseudouridine synthase [Gammaproteobacteria bacterium]